VLGFVGTPWTLAAYAVEGGADKSCTRTKALMTHQPAVLHALLAHLADALGAYAAHQVDCGAQVVQLFDSWAHHLSPAQFREFSLPYAERVMAAVRARHPGVPLIFHANGSAGKERAMAGCSADVLGLDWATDMRDARATFGAAAVLQGNVDPQLLFGPEAVIRAAVALTMVAAAIPGRSVVRNAEIMKLGAQWPEYNGKALAETAIADPEMTVESFRAALLSELAKKKPMKTGQLDSVQRADPGGSGVSYGSSPREMLAAHNRAPQGDTCSADQRQL
jgi:hypothetical protein